MNEALKRKHSQLNDRNGNPIDPRAAAKFLTANPHGSTRTVTKASQVALLQKIKSNLAVLERFAAKLPHGSMRQRSLVKHLAELKLEVQAREELMR